jgi:hypothetical protein
MTSIARQPLLEMLYEAEQRSMARLLEAWDRELEAQAAAHREVAQRQAQQALADAVEASAFEARVRGLLSQAKGGADVSIPSGMRAASTLAAAPCDAGLDALLATVDQAEDDCAAAERRAAAWAMRSGFVPHPSDLAAAMTARGVDAPWAEAFAALGQRLAALDATPRAHPRLAMQGASERVDVVRHEVQLLRAYTPERTLALVTAPRSLVTSLAERPPAPGERAPRMGAQALGQVLDRLFR